MQFDDVYHKLLEDLDTSYSQLYKYPKFTAQAVSQGPVRYGPAPSGFKGDKDGIDPSKIDGGLYYQKNSLSRAQKEEIEQHGKNKDLKQDLLRQFKNLKKRKK